MNIYENEPTGVFFLIDNKSFYASCDAIQLGYNPLKVPLVVLSEAKNTGSGLVLATSPEAKRLFHLKANVSRQRDLPNDPRLVVVPPRMNLYIKKNLQINNIFRRFVADADLWPFSIDESILDLTHSWQLFGSSPIQVAKLIQRTIRRELGLYTTVGIGDNPIQAKIALDVYAKHNQDFVAEIHYGSVPEKVWSINQLTDICGIGERTERRLNKLGINTVYDLAHANPYLIKEKLGVIGLQLFATSWGIDRTNMHERPKPKEPSIGNSQVLPRDYSIQNEIETVIKEIGEQVAARLRSHDKLAGQLALSIGFSFAASSDDGRSGFSQSLKIDPTNDDRTITNQLISMFRSQWDGQSVRNIAVYSSRLATNYGQQLNLFENPVRQVKQAKLSDVIDDVRRRFGFSKLIYCSSLLPGATARQRSTLVGGHNGGNAYE